MTDHRFASGNLITGRVLHNNGRLYRGVYPMDELDCVRVDSFRPRIAMISTHGYVAAQPPLGAADTGGQVVYVLELSKKLAQLGYEVEWVHSRTGRPMGKCFQAWSASSFIHACQELQLSTDQLPSE